MFSMKPASQPTPISALHEILKWSASRPEWQQDALRRIVTNGTISPNDLEELNYLCRFKHKAVTENPTLKPAPLGSAHIPPAPGAEASVNLVSVGDLQGVNRLPPKQTLPFGTAPSLTVIYGDNGSGKSGYARVIKKACRTRGMLPVIRSDAFAKGNAQISTGTILFSAGGKNTTVTWTDGLSCDPRLSNIFVFDSSTANHYLEQDGPATFTPHGLDVLPKLTKTCDAIHQLLKKDIQELNSEITSTAKTWRYTPTTVVGKFIVGLSSITKQADLEALCGNSEIQSKRLGELVDILKSDPKQKAKETRAAKARLEAFAHKVKFTATELSNERVADFKALVGNAKATSDAAKAFAAGQFDLNDLPGTRDDLWRKLWEAARIFSISSAYPEKVFPVTEEEARCVLCQQPIDAVVAERLKAFESFCKDQSQQLAAQAAKALKDAIEKVELIKPLADEHAKVDADLRTATEEQVASIANFVKEADQQLTAIKTSLAQSVWTEPGTTPASPADIITAIANALETRAKTEESAQDPIVRQALETERNELTDREWLGRLKDEMLTQIGRYKRIATLEDCQKDAVTTGITTKNSKLTELLVTDAYCTRFKTETESLGLRTLKVKLEEAKGAKGETRFGLRFEDQSRFTVPEVASEGEQRCIALGAFLAELSQASHQSALVFDDPVSSLDHWHREKIAVRLVQESKIRQVIVFTHDAIFLNDLHSNAEQSSATANYHFLDWKDSQPGWCNEGLPWDCKSPEDRLDKLEKRQRELAKTWGARPSQTDTSNMREAYGWLRATVERIVERVIFADVVFRYRSYVKLKELDRVVGFSQAECDEVARLFKKCCDVTDSHDPAQGKQATVPEPKDLQTDLDAAKQLLVNIRARQKAAKSPPTTPASQTVPASGIT